MAAVALSQQYLLPILDADVQILLCLQRHLAHLSILSLDYYRINLYSFLLQLLDVATRRGNCHTR